MEVITRFPRPVREIVNAEIPLSDGTRLAARIWLPEDAESNPVPAILEYLPYRKRDGTSERDALTHPPITRPWLCLVRVDMRGSGKIRGTARRVSEAGAGRRARGDRLDRRAALVHRQARHHRHLLGRLQRAADRRPPKPLKAIVTIASTDDRYADDIHHMGGCLLNDNLSWASTMFAYMSRPPDPALVGERWRRCGCTGWRTRRC